MVIEAYCSQIGCHKPAKAVMRGRWYCGLHHRFAREAAATLRADAVRFVEGLIDTYVPEMRDQDSGMLKRIAERHDEPADAEYDTRLHISARKMAAQRVLAERELEGAVVCA